MNVQMRIITDENIDQLTSMSYSNNINKLLKTDEKDIKNVISMYTSIINSKIDNISKFNIPVENPVLPGSETPQTPGLDTENNGEEQLTNQPNSPEYNEEQLINQTNSPEYNEEQLINQSNSPGYNTESPKIVQGEELPVGSQVLPTGEIVLPPKQSLNIPFIPASLDNQNTLVNSDLKPEVKDVTITQPQTSILNIEETKDTKPEESTENKDNSSSNSSSSETKKIINI
jgi:hypothetical protein